MRLTGEDEKRGLECVFGCVGIGEDAPAHTQHQSTMTSDEGGKGGFISLMDVAL